MIYHSRIGAVIFCVLLAVFCVATIAVFLYLRNQLPYSSTNLIPLVVGFSSIFLILLYLLYHLLSDAGKVAITLGRDGVKFDRYSLINWQDIEDVYVVEDSDGPTCLWLSVKEGVTFLPDGPGPSIWLAKKTGLHRRIDISGYGSFSMSDNDIRMLLEKGWRCFGG